MKAVWSVLTRAVLLRGSNTAVRIAPGKRARNDWSVSAKAVGWWPKSSMTVSLFVDQRSSCRRFTPRNFARGARLRLVGFPASSASPAAVAAIAALRALNIPGCDHFTCAHTCPRQHRVNCAPAGDSEKSTIRASQPAPTPTRTTWVQPIGPSAWRLRSSPFSTMNPFRGTMREKCVKVRCTSMRSLKISA